MAAKSERQPRKIGWFINFGEENGEKYQSGGRRKLRRSE